MEAEDCANIEEGLSEMYLQCALSEKGSARDILPDQGKVYASLSESEVPGL